MNRSSVISGILWTACAASVPSPSSASARPGPWCEELSKRAREDVYDFTLDLLDGDGALFTLSEFVGRPVWLNFFTSWCGPCNKEAADVERMSTTYADRIHVVGIDVKERPPAVRAFRDRYAITYPIALDSTASVFDSLGLRGYPSHLFFDAGGRLSCISSGDLTPTQMQNEIEVALARSTVAKQAR